MNNFGFIVSGIVSAFGAAALINCEIVPKLYESNCRCTGSKRSYFATNFGAPPVEIAAYEQLSKTTKVVYALILAFLTAFAGASIQIGVLGICFSLAGKSLKLQHAKIGAIAGLIFGLLIEPKIQNASMRLFISLI